MKSNSNEGGFKNFYQNYKDVPKTQISEAIR